MQTTLNIPAAYPHSSHCYTHTYQTSLLEKTYPVQNSFFGHGFS